MDLAEASRLLFTPVTLLLYAGGMVGYFFSMAYSEDAAGRGGDSSAGGIRRVRHVAFVLTCLGIAAHVGHIVTRGVAAGRYPLGNMFEFSSMMILLLVAGGFVTLHRRTRRPGLVGFVLLGGLLTAGAALLLYSEPGPLQPILDTWWLNLHVSLIVFAGGVFTLGAVFNALHLLRDTAELHQADNRDTALERSIKKPSGHGGVAVLERGDDAAAPGQQDGSASHGGSPEPRLSASQLRSGLTQTVAGVEAPWRLVAGAVAVAFVFSLIWWDPETTLAIVLTAIGSTLIGWWAVPYLPESRVLDWLTHRTIVFGFPIWTVGVIAGAMWAEQSWGRFWGWDPKETSSFVLWVSYALYLHARATNGLKRRTASWIGLASFGVFMFTYYAVNLVVTGLHSYGGIDPTVSG